jgi:hypothetical protein
MPLHPFSGRRDLAALEPVLKNLVHLNLCLDAYPEPAEEDADRSFLDVVTTAAPWLTYFKYSETGRFNQRFLLEPIWPSIQLTRLLELDLSMIYTTAGMLIEFLRTAGPTLQSLKFWNVGLQVQRGPIWVQPREESKQAWIAVWRFIRNDMTALRYLDIGGLGDGVLRVVDPIHGPNGVNELRSISNRALYDSSRAQVPLAHWIDQLEFEGDRRSTPPCTIARNHRVRADDDDW